LIAVPIAGLTPLFTQLEAARAEERSRAAVRRAVGWAAAIAIPACLVPCVVGDLFLARWVGEAYRSSARYLLATLAPTTLAIAVAPVAAALYGRGRIARLAAGDLTLSVGGLAVGCLLAWGAGWGLFGFAVGVGGSILAKSAALIPLTARRSGVLLRTRYVWNPLGRALAGGAPGLLILFLLRDLYGGSLAGVMAAGLAGGIATLVGSTAATVGIREIRNLWRSLELEVRSRRRVE
jgi:O-antigen/teichoic acid export membrane protein